MTTVNLRKSGLGSTKCNSALATQQTNGSTPRAYWIKQALVSAGWIVYYSSNGTTISNMGNGITSGNNSSDLWTSASFQAVLLQGYNNASNTTSVIDGIWCCLRSPTMDANGDYLHICLSPSHAQWANPVVRGLTNASSTYGCAVSPANLHGWINGQYSAFLRVGMTLTSSTTAFSGGSAFVNTTSATARGDLPIASNTMWTNHMMGCGDAFTPSFTSLTVVTNGNQFHIIQDRGTYLQDNRAWFSLCDMDNGGYAVIEASPYSDGASPFDLTLEGGRLITNVTAYSIPIVDVPTRLGGWRTAYIKRAIDNSIWTGGLEHPEPVGYSGYNTINGSRIKLNAISCTNSTHGDMGTISDFVVMGSNQITDNQLLYDSTVNKVWFSFRGSNPYLLKWAEFDNPTTRKEITPN